MDILKHNREAWDGLVEREDRWTIPVSPEVIGAARAVQEIGEVILNPRVTDHDVVTGDEAVLDSVITIKGQMIGLDAVAVPVTCNEDAVQRVRGAEIADRLAVFPHVNAVAAVCVGGAVEDDTPFVDKDSIEGIRGGVAAFNRAPAAG